MSTLKDPTINSKDDNLNYPKFNTLHDSYTFQWAKAHTDTTTPDTYVQMQGFVSCKDYVVDVYFRHDPTVRYCKKSSWTEEQIKETCFILALPIYDKEAITEKMIENAEQNIPAVLHPIEKKLGLTPTKLIPITNHGYKNSAALYIIKGDDKWGKNATTISIYLSYIRICFHKHKLKFMEASRKPTDFTFNEQSYVGALPPDQKEYLYTVWEDPSMFFKPIPPSYNQTTGNKEVLAHGQTGLFSLLNWCLRCKPTNSYLPYTMDINFLKQSYFGRKMYKQIYGISICSVKGKASNEW